MGGTGETIKAKTKTELRKKFQVAARKARAQGLYPNWGYEAKRIKKTTEGYEIAFHAST